MALSLYLRWMQAMFNATFMLAITRYMARAFVKFAPRHQYIIRNRAEIFEWASSNGQSDNLGDGGNGAPERSTYNQTFVHSQAYTSFSQSQHTVAVRNTVSVE